MRTPDRRPLRVMAVMGTRPDTIKMAPVVHALRAEPGVEAIVCVTAQHREMLDEVLHLFDIVPDVDLDIMTKTQSLTDITTRVLIGMERVLTELRPDVVLVHGDTTSSSAAALAAFYQKIPVGHVEAGLRTSTILEPFPEEANRRLTGVLARFHFAPTSRSKANLLSERTDHAHVWVTGNTVIDAFVATDLRVRARGVATPSLDGLDPTRPMIFVTAHRRENHGAMRDIARAVGAITAFPERPQIVWPVHPSPAVRPVVHEVLDGVEGVRLLDPLNYAETVAAVSASRFVLTDSGGLQEEAPTLGKPVLVMRRETERPEGLEASTLRLIGSDYADIVEETRRLLAEPALYARMAHASNPYGDGRASARIVAWLLNVLRGGPAPDEFAPAPAPALT